MPIKNHRRIRKEILVEIQLNYFREIQRITYTLHTPISALLCSPIVTNPDEIERGIIDWLNGLHNPRHFDLRPGKFVAICRVEHAKNTQGDILGGRLKVIAYGDTLQEALRGARRVGIRKPLLHQIPGFVNAKADKGVR